MPYGEKISYQEQPEKTSLGLKPYEIKENGGEFVACLPIAGTKDSKGKAIATAYAELPFATEDEAYTAVAAAQKDLGIERGN